ncbi:hypothetical protein HJC23_000260 [Cyclotella cryptica]|uniref:Large ribosomal subunit protein uL15/eL18 domain-containing protein n=1 Tax=Cyclotella cryptica TaxID=29204 RepID=A0ABD3QI92_9STRA
MAARNIIWTKARTLTRAATSLIQPSEQRAALLSPRQSFSSSQHAFQRATPTTPPPSSRPTLSSLNQQMSHLSLRLQTRPFSMASQLATKTNDGVPLRGEPITVLTLSNLHDNPGARKKNVRRLGRGIGSSKGKTCGRGHKGQKARAGKGVHPSFEGGQTKFYKTLPKVGRMKNAKFRLELVPLNIGRVQDFVTMGRLRPSRPDGVLTMKDFVAAGMFPSSSVKSGVKLLAKGKEHVKDKLLIEVPWASEAAIEAVEAKGGYVTTVHHNRLAIRALLKPHKFPLKPGSMSGGALVEDNGAASLACEEERHLLPKRARPPPKYMQYYTDYDKRGYLNPRVQLERMERGLKEIK